MDYFQLVFIFVWLDQTWSSSAVYIFERILLACYFSAAFQSLCVDASLDLLTSTQQTFLRHRLGLSVSGLFFLALGPIHNASFIYFLLAMRQPF
jgi:hypothetical protein